MKLQAIIYIFKTRQALLLSCLILLCVTLSANAKHSKTRKVAVAPLVSGTLGPALQIVEYGNTASTMSCTQPTGGTGSYTYRWQLSTDNSTFWDETNGGPNASFYQPPYGQTVNLFYRVATSSGGITVFSNSVEVRLKPLTPGVLGPFSQWVNYYDVAAQTMTATPATGGNGSYTYSWQLSTDNSTFSDEISSPTTLSYLPSYHQTVTLWYRVVCTSNNISVFTNSVKIIVYPKLVSGTATGTQTINYNDTATPISATAATGGSNFYTYQWQSSVAGGAYTDIPGATALSYSPGTPAATTSYRLVSTSNGASVNSNVVKITVYGPVVSGTASGTQAINYNTAATAVTAVKPTGGNGTYTYQWQSSVNGEAFTDILGANSLSYSPGVLTTTTSYQLISSSNGLSAISNTVTKTVYPPFVSGTASGIQIINYNTIPAAITATAPTGGSGTYTYQWQKSVGGGAYANISGATGLSYSPPALTATTTYQLASKSNGITVTSNAVTVTIYAALAVSVITPASSSLNYNTSPGTLSATPSGGDGTYTYQWLSSPTTAGTYTAISGATASGYIVPALTASTSFKLQVTSNGATATTAAVTYTVYAPLVAGTASGTQTINYNTTAAAVTSTAATGGKGAYTYQWQSSTDNSNWTNIPAATALSYSPGVLTSTMYYRLASTSNGVTVSGNVITVTVLDALIAGAITPGMATEPAYSTTVTLSAGNATGGNGSYSYQWQVSSDNSTWSNIVSATGLSYTPSGLTVTAYFRLAVTSAGATVYSNSATVTINSCVLLSTAPSPDQNSVVTSVPRQAGYIPGQAATTCTLMQMVQYFDGLGRPLQNIQVKGNPTATKDIIQPIAYDEFGREVKKYLPYTADGSSGSYRADALVAGSGVYSFYDPTGSGTGGTQQNVVSGGLSSSVIVTPKPYAQTILEPSPLNRPLEQGAPGDVWQPGQHTTGISYQVNDNNAINFSSGAGYPIHLYSATLDANGFHSLIYSGSNYAAGTLTVTVSHDENYSGTGKGGTVEEYKDLEGHVLLKRTFNHNPVSNLDETLSTYYVYDDLGRLAFVLPAIANPDGSLSSTASQTTLDNLCYQYDYDSRNRLIRKRIPGKDWEYLVYNQLDQLVLSQDGRQRLVNQWTVTKYDGLGRIIMSGLWNAGSTFTQTALQSKIYNAAQWDSRNYTDNVTGYVIGSYPAISNILAINYYDDYNNIPGLPVAYDKHTDYSNRTIGLLTASKTAILLPNDSVSHNMLLSVHYYDDKGLNRKTFNQHYLGGLISDNNYDELTSTYNFDNSLAGLTRQHHTDAAAGAVILTTATTYTYDHLGRKIETDEQINGGAIATLSRLEYNEIGQLNRKRLHSTNGLTFLQDIAYTYNERGWLKSSSAPLFAMQLNYNDGTTPQYNGNIANQYWGTPANLSKNYTYSYDKINRLTAGTASTLNSETGINYDLAGNIKALNRSGSAAANLSYTYTGNQLTLVKKGSANFRTYGSYDGNGNAPSDGLGHNLRYNFLNLPDSVSGLNLSYTYDANGKKLRRRNSGVMTEYVDGIQYTGATMDFVQTEEGRILNLTGTPNYEYTLADHLGNTRAIFDSSAGSGNAKQTDEYYPFGLVASQPTMISPKNNYLYNQKELQDGLNQYDYGARFYDPIIARWSVIDGKAEKFPNMSSYVYAGNNPVAIIDPDGNDLVYFNSKGQEVNRTASNTEFRTFVDVNGSYQEATMPKIIRGYEAPIFQKYDYNIAAQTFIFNHLPDDQLPKTANGDALTGDRPDYLDPTLVKAMITQESNDGTLQGKYGQNGKSDIMQVNVTTTSGQTDWFSEKKQWGLEKGKSATPNQSVYAGIRLLFTKGMKTTTKDGKVISVTWRGEDWQEAVKRYNGGGDANYLKEVMDYFNNAIDPTTDNYVKKDKKKK